MLKMPKCSMLTRSFPIFRRMHKLAQYKSTSHLLRNSLPTREWNKHQSIWLRGATIANAMHAQNRFKYTAADGYPDAILSNSAEVDATEESDERDPFDAETEASMDEDEESYGEKVEKIPHIVKLMELFDQGIPIEQSTFGAVFLQQEPSRTATELRALFTWPQPPNARYILTLLNFLVKSDRYDSKFSFPAAKLVALLGTDANASRTIEGDEQLVKTKSELVNFLLQEANKIPVPEIRKTMLVHLRVCADPAGLGSVAEWAHKMNFKWDKLLEPAHCFRLLAATALVHAPTPKEKAAQLQAICELGFPIAAQQVLYSQEWPLLWPNFMEALQSGESGDPLMNSFFENMVAHEIFEPTQPEFEAYIKPALEKHGHWHLLPAKISHGECNECKHKLEKRGRLTTEEFDQLRLEFDERLLYQSKTKRGGAMTEYNALMRLIHRLRKKLKPGKTPVVIDGLNILYVGIGQYNVSAIQTMLFELVQGGHGPILVTLRWPNRREKEAVDELIEATRALDIHYFMVHAKSLDDLFMIKAAMELGPRTLLVTNDEHVDHALNLKAESSRRLLEVWSRSNVIRITLNRECLYPSMFYRAVQNSPKGYHMFVQPRDKSGYKFAHLPDAYCIQKPASKWEEKLVAPVVAERVVSPKKGETAPPAQNRMAGWVEDSGIEPKGRSGQRRAGSVEGLRVRRTVRGDPRMAGQVEDDRGEAAIPTSKGKGNR